MAVAVTAAANVFILVVAAVANVSRVIRLFELAVQRKSMHFIAGFFFFFGM